VIKDTLGGSVMIEPTHKCLEEAVDGIIAVLDIADHQQRELDTLEHDLVIDAALSLLLTLQTENERSS